MTKKVQSFIMFLMLYPTVGEAQVTEVPNGKQQTCPIIKVETEQLPDLNVPRAGHLMFCVNGELTVVGGHTNGFVPTPTAEYYKNGAWYLTETVYTHDNGLAVVLKSGKVLIAGGHDKHLGIGQTFVAEMYDPLNHQFTGFGCLDQKRSMANAIETDSGHVVIAGNWYHNDAIEVFDGKKFFSFGKEVSIQRAQPYLFRTSDGNVMVVGSMSTKGQHLSSAIVDRLKGDSLHVDLLETWQPTNYCSRQSDVGMISDEKEKAFTYLMPVKNAKGQLAIALVQDTLFSLLPTNCPIPMESSWGPVNYYSPVIVDKKTKRGYIAGIDKQNRLYALCIEYTKKPATLTLYHTDILTDSCLLAPVVTPEGNLAFAGGSNSDNFTPFKAVYLMHLGQQEDRSRIFFAWSWLIVLVAILVIVLLIHFILRHYDKKRATSLIAESGIENQQVLMQRIETVITSQKRYLDSNLKVIDIAKELNVHRNVISDCINSQKGYSFTRLINGYRVNHAKQLLKEHPDMKMSMICTESGFATETSFFRTFKMLTGKTPKEWIARNSHHSAQSSEADTNNTEKP